MSAIDIAETFVLLLAAALALTWLSRRIGVPYPVALVLGACAAVILASAGVALRTRAAVDGAAA